jgi:uncharacterized protein with HEPN domain
MAPSKSPKLRLLHIRDEIDGLTAALGDVDFEAYCQSYALRRATERARQIISEAAKSLPPSLREQASEIPWRAIIGMGNVLRHDYQHLDDRRLWDVVSVHLPRLRPVVERMISNLENGQ